MKRILSTQSTVLPPKYNEKERKTDKSINQWYNYIHKEVRK